LFCVYRHTYTLHMNTLRLSHGHFGDIQKWHLGYGLKEIVCNSVWFTCLIIAKALLALNEESGLYARSQ